MEMFHPITNTARHTILYITGGAAFRMFTWSFFSRILPLGKRDSLGWGIHPLCIQEDQ